MSRFRTLNDKIHGKSEIWATGIFLANIPAIMLENEFVHKLCIIASSALLSEQIKNDNALSMFNISANR